MCIRDRNLNDCYKCENKDFEILAKQFSVNAAELEAEFKLLKSKKRGETDWNFPPKSVTDWINWLSKFQRSSTFENFSAVINKFSMMSVTSCTSERTFSKLSIIKSKLRSTMCQDRLENLNIPFVEQELAANARTCDVIDNFKNSVAFDRRMTL